MTGHGVGMLDFGLDREVALVTGASSGIGQAIALALGRAGVAVGCGARAGARAAETVSRIEAAGGRAVAIEWDVTDSEPVSYTHLRAHETVLELVCRLL